MRNDNEKLGQQVLSAAKKIGAFVQDVSRNYMDEHACEEWEKGKEYQRDKDLKAAVSALLEFTKDEGVISDSLNRYFGVENITEAREYIRNGKMHQQLIALRKQCQSEGMSVSQFREYVDKHQLEQKFMDNPKLLDLSVDKLMKAIKK